MVFVSNKTVKNILYKYTPHKDLTCDDRDTATKQRLQVFHWKQKRLKYLIKQLLKQYLKQLSISKKFIYLATGAKTYW